MPPEAWATFAAATLAATISAIGGVTAAVFGRRNRDEQRAAHADNLAHQNREIESFNRVQRTQLILRGDIADLKGDLSDVRVGVADLRSQVESTNGRIDALEQGLGDQ